MSAMPVQGEKKRILIFADHFKPGFKAGGPIQSLTNLVDSINKRGEVYLFSKNHDLNEPTIPYKGIEPDKWSYSEAYGIHTYYCSPGQSVLKAGKESLKYARPNVVYLNSFFSPRATLLPLLAIWSRREFVKVVLAPRGELAASALSIKATKKRIYKLAFKSLLARRVSVWHATSLSEKEDILLNFPSADVQIVGNLPTQKKVAFDEYHPTKHSADFVLVSRIAKVKNIGYFLKVLSKIDQPCKVIIYGVLEDEVYWEKCKALIKKLSANVSVDYKGSLKPSEVQGAVQQCRFYVSPTLGENFGHAIFEALLASRPLVISDQTPWQALAEKNIGWELPLDSPDRWVAILNNCLSMSTKEHLGMCKMAYEFANEYRFNSLREGAYFQLLSDKL